MIMEKTENAAKTENSEKLEATENITRFIPKGQAVPSKLNDPGLAALIAQGNAVYNAKDGLTVLLPEGFLRVNNLEYAIFLACEEAGITPVSSFGAAPQGADVLRSMAERYLKDNPARAAWALLDGTSVAIKGWFDNMEEASGLLIDFLNRITSMGAPLIVITEPALSGMSASIFIPTEQAAAYKGAFCAACDALFTHNRYIPEQGHSPKFQGGELREVHTPHATTIAELCRQLDITPEQTLKTLIYKSPSGLVMALLRGDRELSLQKLSCIAGGAVERASHAELAELVGEVAGFCGPVGMSEKVQMVADINLKGAVGLVAGANKVDYHVTGVSMERDMGADLLYDDITSWQEGVPCPQCGAALETAQLRQVGEINMYSNGTSPEKPLIISNRDGKKQKEMLLDAKIDIKALFYGVEELIAQAAKEDNTLAP